jgi:class 3 adenylate cyclase
MESFYFLIDEMLQTPPDGRAAAEERIRNAFEVERAVLALDMSGFSLSVRRSGIVAHLCEIRRVQRLVLPLIEDHGGDLVKCVADNVLAVFPESRQAIEAAIAINRQIAVSGEPGKGGRVLTVGIGVDFGKLLLIPGKDAFGDPVNIAHKLGEDIARANEVLATEAVGRGLDPARYMVEPMTLSVGGLELHACRVSARAGAA